MTASSDAAAASSAPVAAACNWWTARRTSAGPLLRSSIVGHCSRQVLETRGPVTSNHRAASSSHRSTAATFESDRAACPSLLDRRVDLRGTEKRIATGKSPRHVLGQPVHQFDRLDSIAGPAERSENQQGRIGLQCVQHTCRGSASSVHCPRPAASNRCPMASVASRLRGNHHRSEPRLKQGSNPIGLVLSVMSRLLFTVSHNSIRRRDPRSACAAKNRSSR